MKKLNKVLFGFGSITAVVAPVAAVVACGDSEKAVKFSAATDLVAFAKAKGYAVTEDQAKQIFDKVGTNAEVIKTLTGKLTDKTHGNDDFAIVIKGTRKQEQTDFDSTLSVEEIIKKGYNVLSHADTGAINPHNNKAGQVDSSSSLTSRWGLTEENLKNATAIIYLQHSTGTVATIEYVEVKTTSDKKLIVTHDDPAYSLTIDIEYK